MNIFPFTPYITNELSVKLLCMVIKTCCILLSILLFISCSDEKILIETDFTEKLGTLKKSSYDLISKDRNQVSMLIEKWSDKINSFETKLSV